MTHAVRVAAGLLVLALTACGPVRIVRDDTVDQGLLGDVERRLTAVRGLRFLAPVPARVLDREGMGAVIARDLDTTYAPGDLERLSLVFRTLGLLPPAGSLRVAMATLLQEQIAALYDPREKTLSLGADGLAVGGFSAWLTGMLTRRDIVGEVLVSHELTHALQDQHYHLPTRPEPLTALHSDRALARRGLLEGDANLASFALVGDGLDNPTLDRLLDRLGGIPAELEARHPDIPEIVRAELAIQYDEGTRFVARAYRAGGFPAVDRLHRDPPTSTEQLLHPERYFHERDLPTDITLGGTQALERQGWAIIYEDTLGELDVDVLLRSRIPPEAAHAAARGWDGDRLRALERKGTVVLVWMTAWDSVTDAEEFSAALHTVLPEAWIDGHGARVLVLASPPEIHAGTLASRVWTESRFRVEPSSATVAIEPSVH